MNINQTGDSIGLLLCALFALIVFRKMKPARSANTNANEISPKTNARLNRVQKVSKCIRLFLQYGIPLIFVTYGIFDYLVILHKVVLSEASHPSAPDSEPYPGAFEFCCALNLIVYLFWYRTALKLFRFFEKGVLFTAETVRCIQILGGIYCARSLLDLSLYFIIAPSLANQWLGAGFDDLFTGLLIIFIGWLIDEARKIQEEQELTV
jgi:hypothetical protein